MFGNATNGTNDFLQIFAERCHEWHEIIHNCTNHIVETQCIASLRARMHVQYPYKFLKNIIVFVTIVTQVRNT